MDPLEQQLKKAYEDYADRIYRLCLYKTSSKEKAQDLTQDTFMKFWNYLVKGEKVSNTKSFLYQVARNLIIDYYRKKKSYSLDVLQEKGFEPSDNSHESIVNNSEQNLVVQVIEKLGNKYKEVVYLRLVEDMSMREIAQTLSISTNNATVRFHRGMKKLDVYMKNYGEQEK